MRASRPFRDTQLKQLPDPASAALYLEEALAAGDTDAFKLALRNVAEAPARRHERALEAPPRRTRPARRSTAPCRKRATPPSRR